MRRMGLEAIYPKPHLSTRRRRAPDLPLFAAKCGDRGPTRYGQRHHLHPLATRLRLPDGGHRLAQPLRAVVAIVEHPRRAVLPRCLGGSVGAPARRRFSTPTKARSLPPVRSRAPGVTGVAISMDGRGRSLDNVFVERLWRTVKYECIYLHDYATPRALRATGRLLRVLQRRAIARGVGLSHAGGRVRGGVVPRATNSWRWSKSTRNRTTRGRINTYPIVRGHFSGRARTLGVGKARL